MSKESTVSLLTDSDEWAYSWLSERILPNACFIWKNKNISQTEFVFQCNKIVIQNRLDEVATAFSVCFSHDGTRLYAGLDSEYRVFDTLMPGRDSHIVSLGKGYQGGIISTLVAQGNLIAAGSFNRDIALYDHVSDEQIVLLRHAHPSGITQIKFLHDNYFV